MLLVCVTGISGAQPWRGVKRPEHVPFVRMENDDVSMGLRVGAELGSKVRNLRKTRGWTQGDLADQLKAYDVEMHQSTIAKLEAALRPTTVHELWALASALGVRYDALIPPPAGQWPTWEVSEEDTLAEFQSRALEEALWAMMKRLDEDQKAVAEMRQKVYEARLDVEERRAKRVPKELLDSRADREERARAAMEAGTPGARRPRTMLDQLPAVREHSQQQAKVEKSNGEHPEA